MEFDESYYKEDNTDKTAKKKLKVLFFFFFSRFCLLSFFLSSFSFVVCFFFTNDTYNLAVPRSALSYVEGMHLISSSLPLYNVFTNLFTERSS